MLLCFQKRENEVNIKLDVIFYYNVCLFEKRKEKAPMAYTNNYLYLFFY